MDWYEDNRQVDRYENDIYVDWYEDNRLRIDRERSLDCKKRLNGTETRVMYHVVVA